MSQYPLVPAAILHWTLCPHPYRASPYLSPAQLAAPRPSPREGSLRPWGPPRTSPPSHPRIWLLQVWQAHKCAWSHPWR